MDSSTHDEPEHSGQVLRAAGSDTYVDSFANTFGATRTWYGGARVRRGSGQRIGWQNRKHRLLIAVRNDPGGNAFLSRLSELGETLGFEFAGTLGRLLEQRGVENAALADELRDKFAFLNIEPGQEFLAMNEILRHGCKNKQPGGQFPNVSVEPDQRMAYTAGGLGPNYQLRSKGSMHDQYLHLLNTAAAPSQGAGVAIAVIDSGFEKRHVVSSFLDLVEPANTAEKDNFGHGTAMASIIQDIVPDATLNVVRMSDQDPFLSEAMLGISAGFFHYKADILNLSFGLPEGTVCSQCGVATATSEVFRRFLHSLTRKPMNVNGPPLLVAATGNEGLASGFSMPARWRFSVAVGSITHARDRSTFSNYGTTLHSRYIMMPGGEESQGTISEWVGEAAQKCFGTSAAAAYASGVLALYMSDANYQNPDRSAFLQAVLQQCQPCHNQRQAEHGLGYLPYA
jgi:Subtilase family